MAPRGEPSSSTAASSSTGTHEPPWSGFIETTGDALIILEAARRGLIPRVTRRLVDAERRMIASGSVFVFDEEESGIRRWTDGLFWSASRILGNFLLYRETDKRGAGHKPSASSAAAAAANDEDADAAQSLSRPRADAARLGIDRARERALVGSLTNSDKFKPGGMVKKTFSLTIGGVPQHLISYYTLADVEAGRLRPPRAYPELAALDISADFLDKVNFRAPPKLERGWDGRPRYRGEADEPDAPGALAAAALGAAAPAAPPAPPLLSAATDVGAVVGSASNSAGVRYEPYASSARRRPRASRSQPTSPTSDDPGPSPLSAAPYALDYGPGYAPYAGAGAGYTYAPAHAQAPMLPPPYPSEHAFTPPTLQPGYYQPYAAQAQGLAPLVSPATSVGAGGWGDARRPPAYNSTQGAPAYGSAQGAPAAALGYAHSPAEKSEAEYEGYGGLAAPLG